MDTSCPELSLSINPPSCGSTLSPSDSAPPEDSVKTGKRLSTSARKRGETWTRDTLALEDDGFQWRKYGEKVILGQTYPRSYFRCSYRYDHGCLATKQVQRIQQHPPIYRTTYIHHHTCNRPQHVLPQVVASHSFMSPATTSFDSVIPTPNSIEQSKEEGSTASYPDSSMGKDLRLFISSHADEATQVARSSSSSTCQTSLSSAPAVDLDADFCLRL